MKGQKLAPGATPAKPATSRPKMPPLDTGKKVQLMTHECQIRRKEDEFSWVEQYLYQCKCHMGDRWTTWRPGDPPFVCPMEGIHDTTNNMPPKDG